MGEEEKEEGNGRTMVIVQFIVQFAELNRKA